MIIENIHKIIEYKGINKRKFYLETGLSNGFIDKVKDIGASKIEKILNTYPEISAEWLLTGHGEMLKNTEPKEILVTTDGLEIPLVSVTAIGGFGSNNFAINERDVKAMYKIPKFSHKKIDFMIEVEGSSMYPKYNSGDIVACTALRESSFIQWNKVHVVATKEQGIIIKRIRKGSTEECLQMFSDNVSYEPFEIPKDEIVGMALVVGVIRLE